MGQKKKARERDEREESENEQLKQEKNINFCKVFF